MPNLIIIIIITEDDCSNVHSTIIQYLIMEEHHVILGLTS